MIEKVAAWKAFSAWTRKSLLLLHQQLFMQQMDSGLQHLMAEQEPARIGCRFSKLIQGTGKGRKA
jgi:hypothetical protein